MTLVSVLLVAVDASVTTATAIAFVATTVGFVMVHPSMVEITIVGRARTLTLTVTTATLTSIIMSTVVVKSMVNDLGLADDGVWAYRWNLVVGLNDFRRHG